MQLPQIDYTNPVQTTSGTADMPLEAAKQLSGVMQEGLLAYRKELTKTELARAEADVKMQLDQEKEAISSRQYASGKELQDLFGDAAPPHVRDAIDTYGDKPIPMFTVSDAIFQEKAKRAVQGAKGKVTGTGWQTHFETAVAPTVEAERHGLASQQLNALHTFLAGQQIGVVKDLISQGRWDDARRQNEALLAIEPAQKLELRGIIDEDEQTDFVRKAAASNDVATIDKALAKLKGGPLEKGDPGIGAIPKAKVSAYQTHLEAEKRAILTERERAHERWLANNASASFDRLARVEAQMRLSPGYRPSEAEVFGLLPAPGHAKGESVKALTDYAVKIMSGEARKTDLEVYQKLALFAAANPEDFANDKISWVVPGDPTLRNPEERIVQLNLLDLLGSFGEADFKHFVGIQTALKKEGRESALFQDFLGAAGYFEAKLMDAYGYDFKDLSKEESSHVGRLRVLVQGELEQAKRDNKGRLTSDQRDSVIDGVLERNVKLEKGWISDSRTLAAEGVDPNFVTSISRGTRRRASADEIKAHWADFQHYQPAISAKWAEASKKPLSMDAAAKVWAILKSEWTEIDAVVKAGKRYDYGAAQRNPKLQDEINKARTSVAIERYLQRTAGK